MVPHVGVDGSAFRRLVAYRLSAELADDLHRQVAEWASFERWSVGLQLVRAADSVGANIAEATGRWTPADKRRFLLIARGSLLELEHWVLRANVRAGLNPGIEERVRELARTLNGLIRHQAG